MCQDFHEQKDWEPNAKQFLDAKRILESNHPETYDWDEMLAKSKPKELPSFMDYFWLILISGLLAAVWWSI